MCVSTQTTHNSRSVERNPKNTRNENRIYKIKYDGLEMGSRFLWGVLFLREMRIGKNPKTTTCVEILFLKANILYVHDDFRIMLANDIICDIQLKYFKRIIC